MPVAMELAPAPRCLPGPAPALEPAVAIEWAAWLAFVEAVRQPVPAGPERPED